MNTQTRRTTHFLAAVVCSLFFLLLFSLIPGVKASADQSFTAPCTGRTIPYSQSGVSYVSSNEYASARCTSISGGIPQFSITVQPNTSTSTRYITLYAKKSANGPTVEKIIITQSPVPTKSLTAACSGGNLAFTASGASSYTYSNTAVCSSRSGNNFVVKTNTANSQRKCTVTVKNSAGNIIYYVYITQNAVPLVTKSVAGTGGSFGRGYSSTVSFAPQTANAVSVTASTPSGGTYSYTLAVNANPSTTAARQIDIIVKNSSGGYLEIIRVTQAKRVITTKTESYNADPRTVTFTSPGAVSTISYSNSAMIEKRTALGSGKYQFKLTQNKTTFSRSNTVTFKDKSGNALATYTITQAGVPLVTKNVSQGTAWLVFYSSNTQVVSFEWNKEHVSKITALGDDQFYIEITANPSTTASRTFNVIAKKNGGAYLEIIRITQPPHTHAYTYTASVDSTGRILTRKCKHCSDHDDYISYQEFLKYQGRADNDTSVMSYMSSLGFATTSTETQNMVKAYKYLHKNNNMSTASKSVQQRLQDLKSAADIAALFANNSKLNNSLTVISAANNAYMFFTAKDAAGKFSSAVKLAGDGFGAGLDSFSGGYLSSALSTVGDALKDNIPKAFKYKEAGFIAALQAYDQVETDGIVSSITYAQVCDNYKDIQGTIKYFFENKFPKYSNICVQKLKDWKAAYEEQVAMNKIYAVLGKTSGVSTSDFWKFVECYTK